MMLKETYQWLATHWVEALATITGLLYIYFSVKQKILLWFFGILNAVFLIAVYYQSGIFAYMMLQFYYLFISIYGWIHWAKGSAGEKELPVTRVKWEMAMVLLLLSLVLSAAIYWALKKFTVSDIPWIDGISTAFSITATWMLARKILEHWLVWIIVDSGLCILYITRSLYLMTILFAVYTVLAVYGYISWEKTIGAKIS